MMAGTNPEDKVPNDPPAAEEDGNDEVRKSQTKIQEIQEAFLLTRGEGGDLRHEATSCRDGGGSGEASRDAGQP